MDGSNQTPGFKWTKPEEVMKLHQLKKRKKALQDRLKLNKPKPDSEPPEAPFKPEKRKNPFAIPTDHAKRSKTFESFEDSSDTLFQLIHGNPKKENSDKENRTNFSNILNEESSKENSRETKEVVRGEDYLPVDWTLKTKVRFFAPKPFAWSQKVRISEEASAITGFVRCLDTKTTTTSLDASSNAKFHQCCLYWMQPSLPWVQLFPRTIIKTNSIPSVATNPSVKENLHEAYTDGLKSLFQLLRTRQCPYFYLCANNFTVLFRAAGIGGFREMNAMVTPTTSGFRSILKQQDIEFRTPLKKGLEKNQSGDENLIDLVENDLNEEDWLKQMGIGKDDIKKINLTQDRITHKIESEIDNGSESLVLIEGIEVSAFYNFLMNCKSIVPLVGPLAGIPPTLLSPVAFLGGTVNSLKIRENKMNIDNETFFSIELKGPILPHLIHNLYRLCRPETSVTASFTDLKSTQPFSGVKFQRSENSDVDNEDNCTMQSGSAVFKKENLTDCGFVEEVLRRFCSDDSSRTFNYDSLKYCNESKLYNWI